MTEREYELQHLRNLQSYQKEVQNEYVRTIEEVFQAVAVYSFTDQIFRLSKYPTLKNRIDELLQVFRSRVYNIITRGIEKEFTLSDTKNAQLILQELSPNIQLPPTPPTVVQDFINAPRRNLRLSDRVWKLHGQFYREIEMNLYAGISEGRSARKMAADMKQFLKEPDRLFKRVKNAKGKLVLSGPARAYKPGQGVYRSSYKNALRLTATETNRAYRKADGERWKNIPFVLGFEIKLSNNHPKFDICDNLTGAYPVAFDWTGWHPFCRCRKIPILVSKEEYAKYEAAILAGTEDKFKFNRIKDVPPQFKLYVADNREKMEGWKRLPDWMSENRKFTKVER